jgi:hypothetical protein
VPALLLRSHAPGSCAIRSSVLPTGKIRATPNWQRNFPMLAGICRMVRRKDTTSAREIVPRSALSWGGVRTFDDQPLPQLWAASADPVRRPASQNGEGQVDRAQVELVEITRYRRQRAAEPDLGCVRGRDRAAGREDPVVGVVERGDRTAAAQARTWAAAGASREEQLDPPISGEPVQYHVSTITHCYESRSNSDNPMGALHHRVRSMTASAPRAGDRQERAGLPVPSVRSRPS